VTQEMGQILLIGSDSIDSYYRPQSCAARLAGAIIVSANPTRRCSIL